VAAPLTETLSIDRPAGRGRPMDAYLARPDAEGRSPGVVVIHELYGLNDNIREVCQRFATEGYVALAIDLFSNAMRPLCLARIMYGMLVRPLRNGTVGELQVVLEALQRRPEVDPRRVGAIGFCMGGAFALQLACVNGDVRAASVFYGANPRPLSAVARACPIVGSYPEQDITTSAGRKLDSALAGYGIPHDIKIYPGAEHSFFNDRGGAYHAPAATDSWARTLAFFGTHLRGGAELA
jgi:carboxymethylenebutenolidase